MLVSEASLIEPDIILFEIDSYYQFEYLLEIVNDPMYGILSNALVCVVGAGEDEVIRLTTQLRLRCYIAKPFDVNYMVDTVEDKLQSEI